MGFKGIIYEIVHEFLDCWNRKEIKGILHLFKNGAIYQTPNATLLFPEKLDGRLTSIEDIEMYLTRLFDSPNYFTTELMDVEKVDRDIHAKVRAVGTGRFLIAHFSLNEYGKLEKLFIDYFPEDKTV